MVTALRQTFFVVVMCTVICTVALLKRAFSYFGYLFLIYVCICLFIYLSLIFIGYCVSAWLMDCPGPLVWIRYNDEMKVYFGLTFLTGNLFSFTFNST